MSAAAASSGIRSLGGSKPTLRERPGGERGRWHSPLAQRVRLRRKNRRLPKSLIDPVSQLGCKQSRIQIAKDASGRLFRPISGVVRERS